MGISFVQRACDQEHHIVDHVAVPENVSDEQWNQRKVHRDERDVVEKFAEGLDGITTKVVELVDEYLRSSIRDYGRRR